MRFIILAVLIVSGLAPAWGQACSNATTQGNYALVCSGFISPVPNAPLVPFSALGATSANWQGQFTGSAKASVGGTVVNWSVVGSQNLSSDCTGTITYDQEFDGKPAGKLNINFHVLNNGQEIRGMSIDPGTAVVCNLRLLSREER